MTGPIDREAGAVPRPPAATGDSPSARGCGPDRTRPGPIERTFLVQPPSAAGETAQVAQAIALVGVLGLLVGSAQRGAGVAGAGLASHQVRFVDQRPEVQRTYRELAAALEEILAIRQSSGAWPWTAELATEGIEPFGAAPWERRYENGILNYIGRDGRDDGSPYYLLSLVEPTPGSTGREGHTGPADETHRVLADGRWVHIGIWFAAKRGPGTAALEWPQRAGWTEIVNGARELEK